MPTSPQPCIRLTSRKRFWADISPISRTQLKAPHWQDLPQSIQQPLSTSALDVSLTAASPSGRAIESRYLSDASTGRHCECTGTAKANSDLKCVSTYTCTKDNRESKLFYWTLEGTPASSTLGISFACENGKYLLLIKEMSFGRYKCGLGSPYSSEHSHL
jgi:hypothetical protein